MEQICMAFCRSPCAPFIEQDSTLDSLCQSYMRMEYHALLHVLKRSHTKTLYYLEDLETESGVARHADSELG